jgi:hypothetical protein
MIKIRIAEEKDGDAKFRKIRFPYQLAASCK